MTPAQLKKAMLADAARSGLSPTDCKKLGFTPTMKHSNIPAYDIPYFDAHGKKVKFYRWRYLADTRSGFEKQTGAKPQRYSQEYGTLSGVYLPPYIDWAKFFASNGPIIFTEGEKKSAAATKAGIPTIGLGGVWSFMSSQKKLSLLPELASIPMEDRHVFICYDSDVVQKVDVVRAESAFARILTSRGAVVHICRIPPAANGDKVGMDDFIKPNDKKSVEAFGAKVLDTAFEYSQSAGLHELNTEVVYLRNMGVVYSHEHELMMKPYDFTAHQYANRFIEEEVITKDKKGKDVIKLVKHSAPKKWLEWPHRAELRGITYLPGGPPITDTAELNRWQGWGVSAAKKGDVTLWRKLLDHLFAGAPAEDRIWFERWCAYPIQHPGTKMATAVVMWGVTQGTGKTLCGHTLMRMYGSNATELKDSDLEDARFEWAENKQFVLADDITGQNNRKLHHMFMTMITQKLLRINKKYVPSYSIPDTINYYFTSNDPDAFFLDDNDRRFFVNEVLNDGLPEALRVAYIKWIESEAGQQALFYHLLNLDMGDFDPQAKAPLTEAKRDMTYISKSELGVFVDKLKNDPDTPLNGKMRGDLFTAEDLYLKIYHPSHERPASPNALAREMKRAGIKKLTLPSGEPLRIKGRRLRLYALRNVGKWASATSRQIEEHYTKANQTIFSEKKEKF